MQWNSASEFFAMGGHGFFVWMAYGVTAAFMFAEPFLARRRHRRALMSASVAQVWKEAAR